MYSWTGRIRLSQSYRIHAVARKLENWEMGCADKTRNRKRERERDREEKIRRNGDTENKRLNCAFYSILKLSKEPRRVDVASYPCQWRARVFRRIPLPLKISRQIQFSPAYQRETARFFHEPGKFYPRTRAAIVNIAYEARRLSRNSGSGECLEFRNGAPATGLFDRILRLV